MNQSILHKKVLIALGAFVIAGCAWAQNQAVDSLGRSLDDIERESFNAGLSPLELSASPMVKVKPRSVKKIQGPGVMELSGEWQLSCDSMFSKTIVGKVPGTVHGAMVEAGRIPDPTVGFNDTIAEKLSYKDWWYKTTFDYNKNWKKARLSFKGVANRCTVYLNGKALGDHEGMMGGPDFILGDELKKGRNELVVHLKPIPEIGVGANVSWVNTVVANCVYGWHYVKIPTLGIWHDVELAEVPDVEIENPYIMTRNIDGSMRLVVNLPEPVERGILRLDISPKNFTGKSQSFSLDISDRKGAVAMDFKIDNPELWWPNGYGAQPLYCATLSLDGIKGIGDRKVVNFGIRTIEMRPVSGTPDHKTYNWKFVINGRPIFIKGANWCLMDFLMDLSPERYGRFLGAAKEQNLNFLRAWGGGLVETDLFYDMCDEMGLMVMQEWPTAWNSHPHQKYEVLKETIDRNTPRIRNHPSLVLWVGGNESNDPFGPAIDYMGRVSIEQDGTRPFHRGEPWGGSSHNHDSWWLDLHLNNALNMQAEFFGEFGMPSLPMRESVDRYLGGEKYVYPLPANTAFEHHGPTFGAWQDMRLLFREVGFTLDATTIDNVILGSQLAQTLGTRRALERARTRWPDKASGAAYYKINDVFPGLSWGSVDYYGAKKYTHYFIKRSASPVVPVILFDQTNLTGRDASLDYYLVDDTLSLQNKPVVMNVTVYDRMMKKLYERSDSLKPASEVTRLSDIVLTSSQTTTPLLYLKTDVRDMSGNLLARNWYIQNFDSKHNAIFDAPKARLEVSQQGNVVSICNRSDTVPAAGVTIEVAGEMYRLDLSDNMLWIDPGETVTVTMNTSGQATVSAWNIED